MNKEVIADFLSKNNGLENFLVHLDFIKENLDFKYLIEENILSSNCQADKICYFLAPIFFEVNLTVFFIDKCKKISNCLFPSLASDSKGAINLFFYSNEFVILYNFGILEDFLFQERPNEVISILKMQYCINCNKNMNIISFNLIRNFSQCENCIRKFINQTLTNRLSSLIKEYYYNFECKNIFILDYCRPIKIKEDDFLYDEECLALTGRTIPQYLRDMIDSQSDSLCNKCYGILDLFKFDCGCKCKKCMIAYIMSFTQSKVILNYYEKSIYHYKMQN
jgi:hypothetical protein